MEPPVDPVDGKIADTTDGPPAVSVCPKLIVLTKRADFLRASHAKRQGTPGIHLQARERNADETAAGIRVGFTCSKKVGNAVARNRAKRRLREVARAILPRHGQSGWDYVLVGRKDITATLPLPQLEKDLIRALGKVHG
ncbi:ribonuclease P protein component [Yoonia sp. 208BN28-4]|uniref:ribonuclease P protein component n=1 Tax=Yoonia sp. 208BN28-4 TaxID=3126505 RepID=UPI0030A8A21B